MIIRVLTAHIASENVAEANVVMRELLGDLRAQPGLEYTKLARRLMPDDSEEMVLIEEWRTPIDLFRWTGGALQKPRLPVRAPRLFRDLVITHFESLDRLPEQLDLEVVATEAPGGGAGGERPEATPGETPGEGDAGRDDRGRHRHGGNPSSIGLQ